MAVLLVIFVSLAFFFFFFLRFERFNEVEEFLRLLCKSSQDDCETSMFSIFAVLNFDICHSVDSTELDEHERKMSFEQGFYVQEHGSVLFL